MDRDGFGGGSFSYSKVWLPNSTEGATERDLRFVLVLHSFSFLSSFITVLYKMICIDLFRY